MKETILYVDDEFLNIELFKANFFDTYNVITASSAFEGLDILSKDNSINVIVSDVKMPEMNGFEFITEVKKNYPDKVCIILSAYRKSDFINVEIDESDIYRYLNKPWRRPEMSQVLEDAIDTYKTIHE